MTSANIKSRSFVRHYKCCKCIRTSFILLRVYTKSKLMFIVTCGTIISQIIGYKVTVRCDRHELRPAACRAFLQKCSSVVNNKAFLSATEIQPVGLNQELLSATEIQPVGLNQELLSAREIKLFGLNQELLSAREMQLFGLNQDSLSTREMQLFGLNQELISARETQLFGPNQEFLSAIEMRLFAL